MSNPGPDPALVTILYIDPIPTGGTAGELMRWCMSAAQPGLPAGSSYQPALSTRSKAFPFHEAELRVERMTLPHGTSLPVDELPEHGWIGIGTGTLGLALDGARMPYGWKAGQEQALPATRALPLLPPGTQLTTRNAGDEPLVLYRVTAMPSERWRA